MTAEEVIEQLRADVKRYQDLFQLASTRQNVTIHDGHVTFNGEIGVINQYGGRVIVKGNHTGHVEASATSSGADRCGGSARSSAASAAASEVTGASSSVDGNL
jgi:hypothetical protein